MLPLPGREAAEQANERRAADAEFAQGLPVLAVPLAAPAVPGRPDPRNAAATIASIERAVRLVQDGAAAAVVTNPISKAVLYAAGFPHPGHTEFLGALTGRDRPVMMLANDHLRVVPVSIHVSLRRAVEEGNPDPGAAQSKVVLIGWGNVRVSGTSNPDLKRFEGKSMEAAAAEEGITPFDLMVRFIEEDAGQTAIVMFQLDEGDLHAACTHPLHMIGSDGLPRPGTRPHPRAYGTFPRVLGVYVREQGLLSLEAAVHKMTGMPAARLGLADRGVLREGAYADIVVFDPATVKDQSTFTEPHQYPLGIETVLVNGAVAVQDGKATGVRAGRVLVRAPGSRRKPQ